MQSSNHIPVLDALRGIAALSVCVYHFSNGHKGFLSSGDPVAAVGSYGWLGVEAFFVISGFVIPYSLHLRSYAIRDSGGFFIRRLKRLEPPYFACILVVIVLHQLSMLAPGFRGGSLDLSWPKLVAHVAYLNAILGYGWLNPVFWTLAIEFQYYIFVAIAFPLLAHPHKLFCYFSALMIALLGFAGFGNSALLPFWLPLFAIGIVTYQYYVGRLSTLPFVAILTLIAVLSTSLIGLQQTVVGLATALLILIARNRNLPKLFLPLSFLGTVSYSLYLLHVPFGMRIINLADRLPDSIAYRYPAIVAAFVISIIAAYLFWQIVERPSQRWSRKLPRSAQPASDEQSHLPEPVAGPIPSGMPSPPAR